MEKVLERFRNEKQPYPGCGDSFGRDHLLLWDQVSNSGTGTHGMGLKVDRMTGETWWLLLEKKVKQKQEEGLKQEEMAPRKTKWE